MCAVIGYYSGQDGTILLLGIPLCIPQEKNIFSIINPFLADAVLSRWPDIKLVLLLPVIDLDYVSVHKQAI